MQRCRDCGVHTWDGGWGVRIGPRRQSAIRNLPFHRSGAFTLVELSVSIAIVSVLMLGMGSAMLLASRAVPDARSPAGATVSAGQAVEQLVTELQYATAVLGRSAVMIEFTVADRDADDVPETIRYEWSGTSGESLIRTCNGGAAVEILPDVHDFDLSYDLRTTTTEIAQANESAETVLKSYQSALSLDDYPIKSGEWYGQYFQPALPADAVSWQVTRIRFSARTDGAVAGESRVRLQLPTTGGMPSGVILEEKTLLESTLLSGYQEQEFSFTNAGGLSPQRGLCITVKWISDAVACKLLGCNTLAGTSDSFLLKSTDSGVSWSAPGSQSLLYAVYGTVTTAGTPEIQTAHHLDGVQVRLRAGSDPASCVQTVVRVLNRPEVMQ
jgi:prepilin-type N-terminal cleavage/methylation domain-containing protein